MTRYVRPLYYLALLIGLPLTCWASARPFTPALSLAWGVEAVCYAGLSVVLWWAAMAEAYRHRDVAPEVRRALVATFHTALGADWRWRVLHGSARVVRATALVVAFAFGGLPWT